jgi:CBS domain-containing protein
MKIAFFLTPKEKVTYLALNSTMQQALKTMESNHFTAIPLIDEKGKYAGTLTEGDLLWKMKNTPDLTFADTSKIILQDVPRQVINEAVKIHAEMEDLLSLAINQNFVPVVDDNENFIGLIRRSDIIGHFAKSVKS